jgi:hypothetical protein
MWFLTSVSRPTMPTSRSPSPAPHSTTERRAPRRPVVVGARVEPERDDAELPGAPDAEPPVNLVELLRADDDDAVGDARQRLLDREEEPRLPAAVVAVEDVAVVRVDEAARARAAHQRRGRQVAVERPGHAPHRAGLRRVGVDDVGALP